MRGWSGAKDWRCAGTTVEINGKIVETSRRAARDTFMITSEPESGKLGSGKFRSQSIGAAGLSQAHFPDVRRMPSRDRNRPLHADFACRESQSQTSFTARPNLTSPQAQNQNKQNYSRSCNAASAVADPPPEK